jgi:flagellar biosynthetic protein FliO
MIIVLGVLLALTWFLKNRVNGGAGIGGQRRMQIVEKVSLGQRQCLALIRIDNEEMLVGISPDRIDELGFTRNARIEKASTDGVAMTAANTETGEM